MADPVLAPQSHAFPYQDVRILAPGVSVGGIGRLVSAILLRQSGRLWWIALAVAVSLVGLGLGLRLVSGVAEGGEAALRMKTIGGASSDWWLAIASGSLMLAAMLHLVEAEWRCTVSRVPELIALLGVGVAVLDPMIQPGHLSLPDALVSIDAATPPERVRLSLLSGTSAVLALLVLPIALLIIRLLPDAAALRRRPPCAGCRERIFALLSRGWHGSAVQWQRWTAAFRSVSLLAILVTAAVQADAALRLASGSASAITPITLLVGAIVAGTGVTAAILAALRTVFGLHALVTERHFDILARIILVLGLASLYCHVTEIGSTLIDGGTKARMRLAEQFTGASAWVSWSFLAFTILPSQMFWSDRLRRSGCGLFLIGTLVALGVFSERAAFAIAASSPDGPAIGGMMLPTLAALAGGLGLFLTLLLLALRLIPILSIADTRRLAITHNPSAFEDTARIIASPAANARPAAGVAAEFASELALAAAIRALAERDPRIALSAYGPAPIPAAAQALRAPGGLIREAALTGALLGGLAQFGLSLAGEGGRAIAPGSLFPAWPFLVAPSVCVAAITGAIAVVLALLTPIRLTRSDRLDLSNPCDQGASAERFVLVVDLRGQDLAPEWIEQSLAALPERSARPSTVAKVPA